MRRIGESIFICLLMENCQRYEAIRDLMEIWFDETIPKELDKIIVDAKIA